MRGQPVSIRFARLAERDVLTGLQRRASMHGPMYRAQLAAHPDAIDLPAEHIIAGRVRVAERRDVVVGFAVLLDRIAGACELDGLFVEPAWMRSGIGRRLVQDLERIVRLRHGTRLEVVANPQALAFYEAMGFITTGHAPTRFGSAPRMSLRIAAKP